MIAPLRSSRADPRAVIEGLDLRAPFAPSISARAGGWQVGAVVAGFAFVVELLGLSRAVTDPATGHTIVEVLRDGHSSAAGWLWCTLARLADAMPIGGTAAWRIALVSALANTFAAGLLAVWLRQRDIGRRASVVGGLLFAFTLPVWRAGVLPGPVPLSAALALLSLVLIEESRAARRETPRLIGWTIAGVTAAQGPLALGMIAAVMAASTLRPGSLPRRGAIGVGAFSLGLAATTLLGGIDAMFDLYSIHPAGWDPAPLGDAIASIATTSGSVGIGAAIGLLLLWRRHPGDAGALTLLAVVPLGFALGFGARGSVAGDPPELVTSLPLTFAALAALAAGGIDAVLQRFAATPSPRANSLTAASAALPLALLVLGSSAADYSGSRYAAEWSEAVLSSLPDDAIIVTTPDPRGGLLEYAQLFGGRRPDVLIADPGGSFDRTRSPLLDFDPPPANAEMGIALLSSRSDRPLFAVAPIGTSAGRWSPWGLIWRLDRNESAPATESAEAWAAIHFTDLPDSAAGARSWIDGELDVPPRDRTARRIAADYFQALARRSGGLAETGRWSPVLDRLGALRASLPVLPNPLPSPGSDDRPVRGSDDPGG